MRTSRAVPLAGALLTAIGAVLVASGPNGLRRIGDLAVSYGGYVLLAAAAIILVLRVLPRGSRALPGLLALCGLVLVSVQHSSPWYAQRWILLGTLLASFGVGMTTRPVPQKAEDENTRPIPYRRELCVLPRKFAITGEFDTPTVLTLTAVIGTMEADLSGAAVPRSHGMHIFVRCVLGGKVVLKLPPGWALVAGRFGSAYKLACEATFDSGEIVDDPSVPEAAALLQRLAEERRERHADSSSRPSGFWVIVHAAGIGGRLEINR